MSASKVRRAAKNTNSYTDLHLRLATAEQAAHTIQRHLAETRGRVGGILEDLRVTEAQID